MSYAPSTGNNLGVPFSEETAALKKKRARRTLLIILSALAGLTVLEIYFIKTGGAGPVSDNIAVLALFNIILILLVLMIVLIIKNLIKLYSERKSKTQGAQFRTKLIVAFLILALVPSTLLFFVASKLFSYSIGSWFNLQVEQTLQSSMEIAREHYAYMESNALLKTRKIENFITRDQLYLKDNREQLQNLIAQKLDEYDLGTIIIYDHQSQVVVSAVHPNLAQLNMEPEFLEMIRKNPKEDMAPEYQSTTMGNYLAIAVPLTQIVEDKLRVWGFIVTLNHFPESALEKITSIQNTYEDYKRQSFLKLPVSANYYTTFLMITLLILFSAIWLGIYIARGITIPIQQLAFATRKIAEGDLNFKIDVQATDEIGTLVESFNSMTDELNESRKKVQQANKNLQDSNIELEKRRAYIASILENIGAGVVSIDKGGRVATFNKAAEQILQIPTQQVFGFNYKDHLPPSFQEPIRSMILNMNQNNKEFWEEQADIHLGGTNLSLLVNIQVQRDPAGKYMGVVIVFEDLTQMIKSQKVAAWKEVAQGIAHEIKNPLTPIQLNTQRLRKKYHENKEDFDKIFDESMDIISQEVEGMKELLNEFLRFSRMPTPNPQPTNLNQVIEDVSKIYTGHEKLKNLHKNLSPKVAILPLDSEQIRRVFINLFENAIDAIDGEGSITISTQLKPDSSTVQIEFSDTGQGISPKDRDKLFLPHFTTKKRGTGLGLAIVTRIVADHGGEIRVKDNPPQGTTFIIELPMQLASKAESLFEENKSETLSF
ncbi:MAG: PAS domain-containing sensor histidine kinase [Nitrospinae bacterium CG11_big_fil_rev_8_21_14_0_20_45_15]|nr:MAG: PAS domain-containing sensor histidine kinase [Nitrospinae bacterium CG11_big_fil_rev_8_21_14_0_20_45_15]